MGVLLHQVSRRRVTLAARTLIGRASTCIVKLSSPRVSAEHAVLFHDGTCWSLRDLGSTNGSWLDGRRLHTGERVLLNAGAQMTFGNEQERWTLQDAGPAVVSAHAEDGDAVVQQEHGLLALPGAEQPLVTLAQDEHGRWLLELDDEMRAAVDLEVVEAGGRWRLHIPPPSLGGAVATTTSASAEGSPPKLLSTTMLRFEVSRDGEFVQLSLIHAGEVTPLGARVHHELLLVLARERLRDVAAELPASEQGWVYVEDLLTQLQLDLHHLNVQAYRARKHLASAGVINVSSLFERRSTTRQIRLGTASVVVQSL